MTILYIVTAVAVLVSFFVDPQRTKRGLALGWKKFSKTLPSYLTLLMIISLVLLISESFIVSYLSQENRWLGLLSALLLGSLTIMPGFIAYPLAKILVTRGVPYMVVAAFVTSLMLVGVLTYPLEKQYFGKKLTVLRNLMSFMVAAAIAVVMGILYGELGI
jgi:uncharacterized membrane protein YraQ (UPF0718 family)